MAIIAVNHRINGVILWFTAKRANSIPSISKSQNSACRRSGARYDYHIYHKHADVVREIMDISDLTTSMFQILQKSLCLGRCKNHELSFLHIGTNTYTRVLCAIKTVPSVLKHPILGRLPLKEISSKYKKLRWCGNEHENSEAFLTKHGSAWQNSISGKNVCKSRPIIFFCGGGTYKL